MNTEEQKLQSPEKKKSKKEKGNDRNLKHLSIFISLIQKQNQVSPYLSQEISQPNPPSNQPPPFLVGEAKNKGTPNCSNAQMKSQTPKTRQTQ